MALLDVGSLLLPVVAALAQILGLEVGLPMLLVLAGLSLVVMEALAPGAHFIVVGIALLAAGLAGLVFTPLASPIFLAVLVGLFGVVTFIAYREFDIYGGKGTAQTSDSGSLLGQRGWVTRRVTATDGEVKLENGGFDPHYAARSFADQIPEGEEVIVVDPGGGNVLTVAAISEVETDEIDRALARDAASDDGEVTSDDGEAARDDGDAASDDGEAARDDGEAVRDDVEAASDDGEADEQEELESERSDTG